MNTSIFKKNKYDKIIFIFLIYNFCETSKCDSFFLTFNIHNFYNHLNFLNQCLSAARKAAFTIDEKEREKAIEETEEAFQVLENELKENFFGGEEIGIVDIAAVFIAFWFPIVQEATNLNLFTNEKFPKLYKWSQDFTNHPIVKEKLPPREGLLAYFEARYESLLASK